MAGLSETDGVPLIEQQATRACEAFERADVWRAVLAVADRMPSRGKMPGPLVVSIIMRELRPNDSASL
jgi:hypothetical protein